MNLLTQARAKFAVTTLIGEALADNQLFNPMTQVIDMDDATVDTDTRTVTFKYSVRERPDEYTPDPRD